jgi:DNA repair photolyase
MRRSVLGKSKIEYTQYYCNFYEGCAHGCVYCYSRMIKRKSYYEWVNPKPVLNAVELLRQDIARLSEKPKDILVSSSTDPYQPKNDRLGLTRQVLKVLIDKGLPFSILTKSASVIHDLDLFENYPKCKVGFTIITLDNLVGLSAEPFASKISDRIIALRLLKERGVKTWVSVEPILPNLEHSNPFDIVHKLSDYVDWFVFGRLNYAKVPKDYYQDMVPKLVDLCNSLGVKYLIKKELKDSV